MLQRKHQYDKKKLNIILIIIIIILITSNILLIYEYKEAIKEDTVVEEVLFKETEDEYDENEKYYATISYKTFKKQYKSTKIYTIAITDTSSSTYNKFIEMINKISYYKNTKIYLLKINNLSKKNLIAFYDLDERLSNLESNYLIVVSESNILSITTFNNEDLNKITEGLGE